MALTCLACLFTHESRPSVLLSRHIKAVQKSTGRDDLWTDNKDKIPNLRTFTHTMLIRPVHWFFTEPIVCAVTIMSGVIFSSVYLQTEGLVVTYEEFGFSERQASLVFFTWIIGLTLTIPLRLNDWRIVSRRLRLKQQVRPEDKVVGFYIAAPVLATALWWFSWTVPPVVSQSQIPKSNHYADEHEYYPDNIETASLTYSWQAASVSPYISLASLILVGACTNEFDGILQGYLTDSYVAYAASANAPLAFGRGLLSGSFPIFGRQMFSNLGPNVAGSVLAGVATLFCFIAFWFWRSGPAIREQSEYAVHVEEGDDNTNSK